MTFLYSKFIFISRRHAAEMKQVVYRNKLRIKEKENKKTFQDIQMRILEQKGKDEMEVEIKEKGKKEVDRTPSEEVDSTKRKEKEILKNAENEDEMNSFIVHKALKKSLPNSSTLSSSSTKTLLNLSNTTPIREEPSMQSTPIGTGNSGKSVQSVNSKSSREMLLLLRKQGGADRKQGGADRKQGG